MNNSETFKNLIVIFLIMVVILTTIIAYNLEQEKNKVEEDFNEYQSLALDQMEKLNNTIIELQEKNKQLNHELNQLNNSYHTLYDDYLALNKSYTKISQQNVELMEELEEAFEKINTFRQDINSSLEWFKRNSQLSNTPDIKDDLSSKCIQDCTINLACIHLVNEQAGFTYKSDLETSGEIDQLQSLEDFLDNEGGDCEDFSLFFKAQYNYLRNKCEEVSLKTYEQKEGGEKFFLDFDEEWYVENARKVKLDKNFSYANVVCGKMYDYRRDSIDGHCIVGFTDKELTSPKDLQEIKTAELMEPQNGMYYGKLNEESSGLYLLEEGKDPETFVNLIISDNDMLLYSESEEKWLSYSYFDEMLSRLEEKK